MLDLKLNELPRYLFAPFAVVLCFYTVAPDPTVSLLKDLSFTGLVGFGIGGIALYYIYRAIIFGYLQRSFQIVQRRSPIKLVRARYVQSNGGAIEFEMARDVVLLTLRTLVSTDRILGQNAAIHGLFQSALVLAGFGCYSLVTGEQLHFGVFFVVAAILTVSAYLLNAHAEMEEVNTLQHHLATLDAQASMHALKLRE